MIYLDNASTTKPRHEAIETMMTYLIDKWYNPSSSYEKGQEIAQDLEEARGFFAKSINVESADEIYFTASGSEADNWAIKGSKTSTIPLYIVTDNAEHHAVLNAAYAMSRLGNAFVHVIGVDKLGRVDPKKLEIELSKIPAHAPVVVSIMMVNNEIGTVQDIKTLASVAHKYNCVFHTDAVQAYGKIPIDVQELGVDMLSVASHKIGAPRGAGFLYIRKNTPILPLIDGGQQERFMRAGTENVAAIMAFKTAAEIAFANMEKGWCRLYQLHDHFVDRLNKISKVRIINEDMPHYCGIISVNCGVPAETMLAYLDQFNIAVSSGSACNSKDDKPSHVLKAIGLSDEEAGRVIRFSISPDITEEQLDYVAEILEAGIEQIGGWE